VAKKSKLHPTADTLFLVHLSQLVITLDKKSRYTKARCKVFAQLRKAHGDRNTLQDSAHQPDHPSPNAFFVVFGQ
jgi:hypothetical protein